MIDAPRCFSPLFCGRRIRLGSRGYANPCLLMMYIAQEKGGLDKLDLYN